MRGWLIGVTLAASAIIVVGCGSSAGSASPSLGAGVAPWQPDPIPSLDQHLATAAEKECRSRAPQAGGLPVILHDQRGDGVDTVVLAGPDARASCQVAGDESGKVRWLTGSTTPTVNEQMPGTNDITIEDMSSSSGSDTGTVSDISGRTGTAIVTIKILLDDGRQIVATTDNGWFYAWWPGESTAISVSGRDLTGRQIASATP